MIQPHFNRNHYFYTIKIVMFRRTTAILLAQLVLVSSTGYSITAHLCHGKAVSYSLFGRPADCGLAEESAVAEHCDHPDIIGSYETACQTQECCTNESQFIKGIETAVKVSEQSVEPFVYTLPENMTVPGFAPGFVFTAVKPPFNYYHPPQRTRDWPVWLCVFRL